MENENVGSTAGGNAGGKAAGSSFEGGMGASYGSLPGRETQFAPAPAAGAGEAPAPVAEVKPEVGAPATEVKEGVKDKPEPAVAELQERGAQEQQSFEGQPFELRVPEFVPSKEITEERHGWVREFAQVAPQVGLSTETAQGLMDLVVDCAVTLPYTAPDQYTTAEDAKSEMARVYGDKVAQNLIGRAQKYVGSSEALRNYLDRTGLGNDVGVISALALTGAGWLALTPTQAEGATKRLMSTKEFAKGDPLTIVKLQMLSRIANREAAPTATSSAVVGAAAGKQHEAGFAKLKQEASALIGKKGGMSPDEKTRFMQITSELARG